MLQYLLQYTVLYLLLTTTVPTLDATVYLCILLPHNSTSTKPTERTPRPRPNVAMLGRVPPKGLIFFCNDDKYEYSQQQQLRYRYRTVL